MAINLLVEIFLFVCVSFLKKKYIFSYTFDLCGRVGDKKIFTRPISGNKTNFFFGLILKTNLLLFPTRFRLFKISDLEIFLAIRLCPLTSMKTLYVKTLNIYEDTIYEDTMYMKILNMKTLNIYEDTIYEDTMYMKTLNMKTLNIYEDTKYEDTNYI